MCIISANLFYPRNNRIKSYFSAKPSHSSPTIAGCVATDIYLVKSTSEFT